MLYAIKWSTAKKKHISMTEQKLVSPVQNGIYACLIVASIGWSLYTEAPFATLVAQSALSGSLFVLVNTVHRIPRVQRAIIEYKEGNRVSAIHWAQDKDLQHLTWVLRFMYSVSGVLYLSSFLITADMSQVDITEFQEFDITHERYRRLLVLLCASLGFVVTCWVQLLAELHIICYRNPVTPGALWKLCIECAKIGTVTAGIGGTLVDIHSNTLGAKANSVANMLRIWGPHGEGYGYEVGTSIPSARDSFLKSVPGYNSLDHVNPKTHILDEASQNKWVDANIATVRKHLSTGQLMSVGIDPRIISRRG